MIFKESVKLYKERKVREIQKQVINHSLELIDELFEKTQKCLNSITWETKKALAKLEAELNENIDN